MQYGLLGEKLSHSFSPQIHKQLADYPYDLYEVKSEDLGDFLIRSDFDGLNITIPYKKAALPFCDQLSDCAQRIGAVNTIVRRSGKLIGHNSDYFGFKSLLLKSGLSVTGKKVLILGSGGAAATVNCVLQDLKAHIVVISRTGENNYANLQFHADAAIIVNTTPVGMYPETGISPVDLSIFPVLEGVLDIIYNPAKTKLLLDAEARGLVAVNGLWMLIAQAKESAEWFTGRQIADQIIERIYRQLQAQTKNLALIGMPGCGKSTVGALLSEMTGKRLVDTDRLIEAQAGISIPEIFALYGEAYFRDLESQIIAQLGKESGLVIATGGGCVTRPVNHAALRQNATVYWLQRNLDLLSTDGRPLSQRYCLETLYQDRVNQYQALADHIIDNNCSPRDAAGTIFNLEVCL